LPDICVAKVRSNSCLLMTSGLFFDSGSESGAGIGGCSILN